jgi:hypothetical protein
VFGFSRTDVAPTLPAENQHRDTYCDQDTDAGTKEFGLSAAPPPVGNVTKAGDAVAADPCLRDAPSFFHFGKQGYRGSLKTPRTSWCLHRSLIISIDLGAWKQQIRGALR